MVNTKLLYGEIKNSGYRVGYVASRLGITYSGFRKKTINRSEFKATEIKIIADLLGLSMERREEIFFGE